MKAKKIAILGSTGSIGTQALDIVENNPDMYSVSVLLKAGHLTDDELIDIFYDAECDTMVELKSQRVYSRNTHGTGCTLSSAMAAMLAKGMTPVDAARAAKDYINGAIVAGAGYEIGGGHGPVHHFHEFWK